MTPIPLTVFQDHLLRAWIEQDYSSCHDILAAARAAQQKLTSGKEQYLAELATLLQPMKMEFALRHDYKPDGVEAFQKLREEIMSEAALADKLVMVEHRASHVAIDDAAQQWGQDLIHYMVAQADSIGNERARSWEIAALVQWCATHLLEAFPVTEDILITIFRCLLAVDKQINWQAPRPSITKHMLRRERIKLQGALVQQALRLAEEGALQAPENLIGVDLDGGMLSMLVDQIQKIGLRHPNSFALLYYLVTLDKITLSQFHSLVRSSTHACFIPLAGRILLAAGEVLLPTIGLPLHDCAASLETPFRLSWWCDVNFPREQIGNAAFMAARIPAFVRELLQKDQADLCLSAMGEASWFAPHWVTDMHDLAQTLGCKPQQIIYLPQNAQFLTKYKTWRQTHDEGPELRIIPINSHFTLDFRLTEPEPFDKPSKKFLCFNQRPHLHRYGLLLSLHRDGFLDDFHISFNQSPLHNQPKDIIPLSSEALSPWLQMPAVQVEKLMQEVEPTLPKRLDLSGISIGATIDGNYVNSVKTDLFADCVFYVVTETEMETDIMCRVTEKTTKAFAGLTPFILLGSYGGLRMLRDLGFRTFAPVIDESYDDIADPVARFQRAYAEIRRLQAIPMQELIKLRHSLHETLQHNRNHMINLGPVIRERLQRGLT